MNKKTIYNLLLSVAIILTSIWFYIYKYETLQYFDKKFVDVMFKIRGEKKASDDILIVDIDERSLKELGQWPWQRYKMAKILENLTKAEVGIIGLDIVFAEPDNSSPLKVLKELGIKTKNPPDFDKILALAIGSSPTIAGYVFGFDKVFTSGTTPQIPAIFIEKNLPQNGNFLLEASSITLNIPIIQDSAYSSGFFNTFPDNDGIVRSVPLLIKYNDEVFPSLSLEMIRAALGVSKVFINYSQTGIESINIGDLTIPTDRHGRLFVNYKGKSKSFSYLSAVDIYNNNFDKDLVKGKIILVGTSALGLLDLRATPFESTFAGVEVHANAIDNIINKDFIYRPDWAEAVDIFVIIVSGAILAIIFTFAPALFLALFSFLVFGIFFLFIYYMLFYEGIILNTIFPLVTMVTLFATSMIINYFFETKQKELIKDKFSKKVSPAVVEDLLKHASSNTLEIREKEITIFFSDIRGFTSISEKIGSPKKLIELLNRYMTPMVEVIIKYHGTIDKFIGDAIMAYWNAPNDLKNHQDNAIMCAIDQIKRLKKLNVQLQNEKLPIINIGIGIHTGIATVGEMGSEGRSDYTVIGDNVNLASRLEGLNKYYGSHIIISEHTYKDLKNEYAIRELDTVRVKGKEHPVKIYEVLGSVDSRIDKEIKLYNAALGLYKNSDFVEAKKLFVKLYESDNLKLYDIYIKRCAELIKNPPKKFEGIYEFTTK